jgi:hypothetical protein
MSQQQSPQAEGRQALEQHSLERLADELAYAPDHPDSYRHYIAAAELERRKAAWHHEASEAQRHTAEYTKSMARYMLWTVIAIAVTSGITALFASLSYLFAD